MPVLVLLPLERGIGLADIGLAFFVQGMVVLALELPTGGLADAVGRRVVLVGSTAVGIASVAVLLVADSFAELVVVFVLRGVFRALDSGPLEAWYVDSALALDPDTRLDVGLSARQTVVGTSIAVGALLGGVLVAWDPLPALDALALPVLASLGLMVVGLLGLLALMVEHRPARGLGAVHEAARSTSQAVRQGLRVALRSRILMAVLAVELFWGFGMVTFESLMPVRLAEVVGDADLAAAITGPAGSAGWLASAAGAAAVPWFGRRIGIAPTAALMRVLQGACVAAMGLFTGLAGVIAAYLCCYSVHGASNPAHMTLLHREVEGPVRATVVSLNSMVAQPAGSVGTVVLTSLAAGTSVSAAMYVGGLVLALAAPLYLPAWRKEQSRVEEPAVA